MRAPFLDSRLPYSSFMGPRMWKDKEALWGLLYKGTNLIPEGSTLVT